MIGLALLLACAPWGDTDLDGDGHAALAQGGDDCDDGDPDARPGAPDALGDGLDADCDGVDGQDGDGDGAVAVAGGGQDCDDDDPGAAPWQQERCAGGADEDCDGIVDEGCLSSGRHALVAAPLSYQGPASYDEAGNALAGAGDVDGDGDEELIISGRFADYGGQDAGAAWIIAGDPTRAAGARSLALADARLDGRSGDLLGGERSLARGGDVNGDGLDEIFIGSGDGERAWLFWGRAEGFAGAFSVSGADVTVRSEVYVGELGARVAGGGDVDGDGFADLLVSARRSDVDEAGDWAGRVFWLPGPLPDGDWLLDEGSPQLLGEHGQAQAGQALDVAGDLDGDGLAEIVVSAVGLRVEEQAVGGVYLVSRGVTGRLSLADADARLWGDSTAAPAGQALSTAGDVDGDGLDDLLVGAQADATQAGRAWLVLGSASGLPSGELSLAAARFDGAQLGDRAGFDVRIVGDMDGDARAELVIGALGETGAPAAVDCVPAVSSATTTPPAAFYLVRGPVSGVSTLGERGATLLTQPGGGQRFVAVTALDHDGDGLSDLAVAATRPRCWAGITWIFFGDASG